MSSKYGGGAFKLNIGHIKKIQREKKEKSRSEETQVLIEQAMARTVDQRKMALRGTSILEVTSTWLNGGVAGGAAYNLENTYPSQAAWRRAIRASVCFARSLGSQAMLLLRDVAVGHGDTYQCIHHETTLPKCHALGDDARLVTWLSLAEMNDDDAADLILAVIGNIDQHI